jgi:hypothetical protein
MAYIFSAIQLWLCWSHGCVVSIPNTIFLLFAVELGLHPLAADIKHYF